MTCFVNSLLLFILDFCLCVVGRSFVIQQIPSSNLFMVVVDNKCDCSSTLPVTMDPIEIMYILSERDTIWTSYSMRSSVTFWAWIFLSCTTWVWPVRLNDSCACSEPIKASWHCVQTLDAFEHNESLKCDRLKFQKDRKKPESCHPFHPEVWQCVCVHMNIFRVEVQLNAVVLPLTIHRIHRV